MGVRPHLEAGAYRSNICVAAAATPRATVAANSGVDIDPGVVRALALGGTRCVSGPPGAMLRPPISIAVSVVCVSATGRSQSLTLRCLHRICCRLAVITTPSTGRCSYTGITSTTRWCILIVCFHLLIIIIVQVIIRVRILIEARVPVDVIRVKDRESIGTSPSLLIPSLRPWSIPFVRVRSPVAVPEVQGASGIRDAEGQCLGLP